MVEYILKDYRFLIVVFIVILGVISSYILTGLKRGQVLKFIRSMIFFICISRFCASAVKCCTGDAAVAFFDSFWDMEFGTCIHYGIPLFAVGVLSPFVLKKLFPANRTEEIINISNTCMILELFIMLMLRKDVNNLIYVVFFVIDACVSVLVATCNKKEMLCAEPREYKEICLYIYPFVVLFIVMTFIYYPSTLYISNISEFVCSYRELGGVCR